MILLDTNVISALMQPNFEAKIEDWLNNEDDNHIYISCISIAEIEYGIALLPLGRRQRDLRRFADDFFQAFSEHSLYFGDMAAQVYGSVRANRRKIGRPIHVPDAQIASIALAHGLTLATRNTKDFTDIPNLQIINPWEL